MAAPASTHCNHAGCYCKAYVVPTSKWSKGKCKNCNHSQKEHGELASDVSFDSTKTAAPPTQNTQYAANIDGKMGIVPSGKTNYKEVSGYGGGQQTQQKSIYSVYILFSVFCILAQHKRHMYLYLLRSIWMNQIGLIGVQMIYWCGYNKKRNSRKI